MYMYIVCSGWSQAKPSPRSAAAWARRGHGRQATGRRLPRPAPPEDEAPGRPRGLLRRFFSWLNCGNIHVNFVSCWNGLSVSLLCFSSSFLCDNLRDCGPASRATDGGAAEDSAEERICFGPQRATVASPPRGTASGARNCGQGDASEGMLCPRETARRTQSSTLRPKL